MPSRFPVISLQDDNKFVYSIPFGPESCPGGMLWWNQVLGASFLRMPDNFGLPPKEFAVVLKDSKKLAALCRKTGLTEEEVRRRSEPGIYSSRIGSLVPKETNPLTNPFLKPSDRRFMPPADKGIKKVVLECGFGCSPLRHQHHHPWSIYQQGRSVVI